MRKIILLFAVLITFSLTSGCIADSAAPSRDATDNPIINRTIDHLLEQDLEKLLALVEFNQQPCTTADGLGGPPKCAEGIENGTIETFFPVLGPGEGAHLNPDQIQTIFDYRDPQLYQVVFVEFPENPDEIFPAGNYAVVLAIEPHGFARSFRLDDEGKIVRVDFTAWSAEEEAERIQGEILFSN